MISEYSLDDMKEKMREIVYECSLKYEGGENYFDELDGMIRADLKLMPSFIQYVVNHTGNKNIILTGTIGEMIFQLADQGVTVFENINMICVNGGLRKGSGIYKIKSLLRKSVDYNTEGWTFIDDSYYSGKTVTAIYDMFWPNLTINGVYVLYDGSPVYYPGVKSLFQYYKKAGGLLNGEKENN